jgi:superfamily II DNA or RNA helicase
VLHIGNRVTRVLGPSSRVIQVLEKCTSYRVAGFMFSPAWRNKVWDGREHLLKFSRKHGYTLPTGLAVLAARKLRAHGIPFDVKDETIIRAKRIPIEFGFETRAYQDEAIAAILSKPFAGRGILKMPVRSGKTRTGGKIIARLGLPTLFMVPSKGLLHQTYDALSEMFPDISIGRVGDSIYEPGFITVATVQTLLKLRGRPAHTKRLPNGVTKKMPAIARDSRYTELMSMFDVALFDECHRLKGSGSWHEVAYEVDARYKIGLSATAYLDNDEEQSKGAIWMIATCGPMRYDLPVSRLVNEGFLMRQNVEIHTVRLPDWRGRGWSNKVREACIDRNHHRNELIARMVKKHVDKGLRVLVIARHRPHIAELAELISRTNTVTIVQGNTSQHKREQAAQDLADRSIDCIVGNVFGEGIDLPSVEVVINAEGGKGDIQTVQRQRNLTMAAGKKTAIFIDFLDQTNEYLQGHSEARIANYESESSFRVRKF